MLLTRDQMKGLEEAAFARGATADGLMEQAGVALARIIPDFFPTPSRALVVCGKGHNAGDVLVAARQLALAGWEISVELAFPEFELAPLSARKLAALRELLPPSPVTGRPTLVLDGLLGIGAQGEPREPVAAAIERINRLRLERGAFVVAADIPSGLDADTGTAATPCVMADLTVAIGFAKTGLLADAATNFVGRLAVVPLEELAPTDADSFDRAEVITPELLSPLLPPRNFDSHKGIWGRVGIIAGSPGYLGAARLCAEGALRAGAGLVTIYALPSTYSLIAAIAPPEVMVRPVPNFAAALSDRLDALAIGPGLGSPDLLIRDIVVRFPGPMVVDADALNLLARHPYAWRNMAGPRLFTPHPGEMSRLFPGSQKMPRRSVAEQYASRYRITVLLKGSRTVIAHPDKPTAFNSTGNPGMGSGGMGDVLTGVCTALLAQGRTPRQAAMLGAWCCGRAAERYIFGPGGSPESLVAGEVIRNLGAALGEIRA